MKGQIDNRTNGYRTKDKGTMEKNGKFKKNIRKVWCGIFGMCTFLLFFIVKKTLKKS